MRVDRAPLRLRHLLSLTFATLLVAGCQTGQAPEETPADTTLAEAPDLESHVQERESLDELPQTELPPGASLYKGCGRTVCPMVLVAEDGDQYRLPKPERTDDDGPPKIDDLAANYSYLSPDGTTLIYPTGHALRAHDLQTGDEVDIEVAEFEPYGPTTVSWSADQRHLAIQGDKFITVIDIDAGASQVQRMDDDYTVAAVSDDGELTVLAPHTEQTVHVAVSPVDEITHADYEAIDLSGEMGSEQELSIGHLRQTAFAAPDQSRLAVTALAPPDPEMEHPSDAQDLENILIVDLANHDVTSVIDMSEAFTGTDDHQYDALTMCGWDHAGIQATLLREKEEGGGDRSETAHEGDDPRTVGWLDPDNHEVRGNVTVVGGGKQSLQC